MPRLRAALRILVEFMTRSVCLPWEQECYFAPAQGQAAGRSPCQIAHSTLAYRPLAIVLISSDLRRGGGSRRNPPAMIMEAPP